MVVPESDGVTSVCAAFGSGVGLGVSGGLLHALKASAKVASAATGTSESKRAWIFMSATPSTFVARAMLTAWRGIDHPRPLCHENRTVPFSV